MFPALYAILDPAFLPIPPAEFALNLADAGVELIQLRDKRAVPRKMHADASELVAQLSPRGVRVVVNDRPDIAAMVGAGGVHVGQEDLPVDAARRICGSSCWVGISTHNLEQFHDANRTSADYIAVGPIFPTAAKENPDPVVGIEFVRAVRRLTSKPIVAIGGITVESAAEVFRAGADSVAVIRDLLSAPDPAGRAREYLEIAARHKVSM
ncbi:MAG: thiamine phosphate synthase [Candidatus Acidiferrales bacterium]